LTPGSWTISKPTYVWSTHQDHKFSLFFKLTLIHSHHSQLYRLVSRVSEYYFNKMNIINWLHIHKLHSKTAYNTVGRSHWVIFMVLLLIIINTKLNFEPSPFAKRPKSLSGHQSVDYITVLSSASCTSWRWTD